MFRHFSPILGIVLPDKPSYPSSTAQYIYYYIYNFGTGGVECCVKDNIHGISLMKEARADPKVGLESPMECPFRGIFFCP